MNLRALCVCQASFQIAGKDGPRVTAWGETRSPPNKKYHLRAWDESEESFTKRIKKTVGYVNNGASCGRRASRTAIAHARPCA